MQIKRVAQGCRLGNQAEFVPRPNMNTNQHKNSIVENISRSTIVHIGASTRLMWNSNKFGQVQELTNDNYSYIKLYSIFHIEYKAI